MSKLHIENDERREHARYSVSLQVDYSDGEHFLFSYIENISRMGIFLRSDDPFEIGTEITLRFAPPGQTAFALEGEVMWVNPVGATGDDLNPGMGVRFTKLSAPEREKVVELIRTIAYLREAEPSE